MRRLRLNRRLSLLVAGLTLAAALIVGRSLPHLQQAAPPVYSASSSWYDVYFTNPVIPDRRERHQGGIEDRFIDFVNQATSSLDLAAYEFDLASVAAALAQTRSRSVRVRMVTDSDTLSSRNQAVQRALDIVRQGGIPIVADERQPIMHHKFAVRDGQETWTGSWNITEGDSYRLNNNAIRIRSAELAANFTSEFEKMFVNHRFGPEKPSGVPHPRIAIGQTSIDTYFSPEDRPARRLAERINSAASSVHFLAFSFTDDLIGRAVLGRHQAGVQVAGVFERAGSETTFSEFSALKQAGAEVYQDGSPYSMHHKVFILDGRTTIFGSFNFSASADRDNDENVLIVDDPSLAGHFEAEFQRVLALARSGR